MVGVPASRAQGPPRFGRRRVRAVLLPPVAVVEHCKASEARVLAEQWFGFGEQRSEFRFVPRGPRRHDAGLAARAGTPLAGNAADRNTHSDARRSVREGVCV